MIYYKTDWAYRSFSCSFNFCVIIMSCLGEINVQDYYKTFRTSCFVNYFKFLKYHSDSYYTDMKYWNVPIYSRILFYQIRVPSSELRTTFILIHLFAGESFLTSVWVKLLDPINDEKSNSISSSSSSVFPFFYVWHLGPAL